MPRKVVTQVPRPSGGRVCCFCGLDDDNELEYGKFHEYNGIITHYYCLLLSSNMQQKGRDDEGILGFLPDDINKELKRGRRLACCYCKKIGATLGCCNTKCKKIFHYPCGLKAGSLHQFFGEFRSYCKSHRPKQNIDNRVAEEVKKRDDMICYICYDDVSPRDIYGTLWAPCCKKNAWFHRTCVQQLAMSAGYFFKCPLCNNKAEFQRAMLDHGIFIPSQDASWELVPNAFEELLYRHNRCDADDCLCPKGREHTSTNAKWELTLCRTCGSQGIHMACGQLKWVKPIWECSECTSILNKTLMSDSESSSIVRDGGNRRRLREDVNSIDESSDSDISVGNETMEASTSESFSLKNQEYELGKSPEEPMALRITRRSVIPIPKSPVNTKILIPKSIMTNEDLPPEPKRPRYSDYISENNGHESIDSDDEIVVIPGPSRNDNLVTNVGKGEAPKVANSSWSAKPNNDPSLVTETQQEVKKSEIPLSALPETLGKTEQSIASRLSTEIEKKVVEIDLSESEYAITETRPTNSIVNEIPVVNSLADPPELNIMITNVTSLAPEAFDSVEEEKIEAKNDLTSVSSRIFNETNGGLTSQTPIVLDDEPLPAATTNNLAKNNNLHFSPNEIHDQLKIIRFDSPTDAAGNPTKRVVYGITIPGTNQTLPLIFTTAENSFSNATSVMLSDPFKPIVHPNDVNLRNDNQPIRPANNSSIITPPNITPSSDATRKPENHQIASTATKRSSETPIAAQNNASSLSISVPLKAIVNERFPTSRSSRKLNDKSRKLSDNSQKLSDNSKKSNDHSSNKTVTINSHGTLSKVFGTPIAPKMPIAPKNPVAQPPTIIPNGSYVKMSGVSIFPNIPVAQPKPPISNGFASLSTLNKPVSNSQNNVTSNRIDATTISKMFALLPPSFPVSKPKSPLPNAVISSTTSKISTPPLKQNNATVASVNGNIPNATTTWLSSSGSVVRFNNDVTTTNLSIATQSQNQKSTNDRQQIVEPQIFQLIRTDQNYANTDDCDGDAGTGPVVQPASVNNPRNVKPRRVSTSPGQCSTTSAIGKRDVDPRRISDPECDDNTDDASDRSASPDWSDACNRAGLIYKSVNLRDLKFSICGSNIVKMTICDTYTVNMKLDSSNSCKNSKYSSSRRTTKFSMARGAKARNKESCDSNDISDSLDSPPSSKNNDNDGVLDQSESTSQDNVSGPISINQTNGGLPCIEVSCRGQDEVKENLDPIPLSTNSSHNTTNAVDRKNKLRQLSDVNHSIRSLNEKDGQQIICEKNETLKKVASHECQSLQNHGKVLYNGWKDSATHDESNVQNLMLDRSVKTVTKNMIPRSSVNDNNNAEDSDPTCAAKRKRISVNDENLSEIQNFTKLPTTKEPNDCNNTNVNHLVKDATYSKRKWKSSDDVSRSRKFHVNNIIDGRKKDKMVGLLSCKVSIDLAKIRADLFANLNISKHFKYSKVNRRSVATVTNIIDGAKVFYSKSLGNLFKSRSSDNLTCDRDNKFIVDLRKSKSFDNLCRLSSRRCIDDIIENRSRGEKKKSRSFEEHDSVR